MDIATLKAKIAKLQEKNQAKEWFDSLEDRKKEEATFHDMSHHEEVNLDNKKWYSTTDISRQYVQNWLKINLPNKVVLDYACGNGVTAVDAARAGAALVLGIDISPVSVQNAQKFAQQKGFEDKCVFFQGDCENTELPDNSVDIVLCMGVLHHMNLDFVYPEIQRILKPGGKLIASEALNYNPFIRLYRMRTPEMRTEWEKHHILSLKDVKKAKAFFDTGEVKFWHITSFFTAFFRKMPFLMKPALAIGNFLDSILTKIPGIQLMAWQFTFELLSKKK